jgi:hypothetical protein
MHIAAVALCIGSSGCATQRINDFSTFAQSGTVYVGTANKLLDENAALAVDETSWQLVFQKRNGFGNIPSSELAATLARSDTAVRTRLTLINNIKQHNALLQKYFGALAALASNDHRTAISASAASAASALQDLHATILKTTALQNWAPAAAPLATIIVGQFQKKALEDELKARSSVIRQELKFQEELMSFIVDLQMKNVASVTRTEYSVLVSVPYEAQKTIDLASPWVGDRRTILRREAVTALMQQATRATADLRETFEALVENKGPVDFSSLIADLDTMLLLVESVKAATQ